MTGTVQSDASSTTGTTPPQDRLKYFGWIDVLVILFVATGTIITIPALGNHTSSTVTVFHNNRIIATYPLDEDRTFQINGTTGEMTIVIRNGKVAVSEADCPLGICKKTGNIRHPHAQIVCAPNHIVVVINSSTPDTIDAIAR